MTTANVNEVDIKVKQDKSLNVDSIEKTDYGYAIFIDTPWKYADDIFVVTSKGYVSIDFIVKGDIHTVEVHGIKSDDYKVVPMKYVYGVFLFENLHCEGIPVKFKLID